MALAVHEDKAAELSTVQQSPWRWVASGCRAVSHRQLPGSRWCAAGAETGLPRLWQGLAGGSI